MTNNPKPILLITAILLSSVAARAATLSVSADSNIYAAGHSIVGAGQGGQLPPGILFSAASPRSFQFTASGSVRGGTDSAFFGPDGGTYFPPTNVSSFGGISATLGDQTMFLVGVFLDDLEPSDPAPAALNFGLGGIGTNFGVLSPALRQTFFIGDGLTGSGAGTPQTFIAPANATRLFLGFADAFEGPPRSYGDNEGSLTVNAQQVPEPSTACLLIFGAAISLRASLRRAITRHVPPSS